MTATDLIAMSITGCGCLFFVAGSVGMLRFPDVFARLHAATKTDNLGLGLVLFGLLWQADDIFIAFKLVLTWLLMLVSSSAACHLIAQSALRSSGIQKES